MEYLRIEGKRRGSWNYVVGEYIYVYKDKKPDGMVLRCNKWRTKSCRGTAFMSYLTKKVDPKKDHTCTVDPFEVEEIRTSSTLKQSVTSTTDDIAELHSIITEHASEEVKSRIGMNRVSSNLYKIKKRIKLDAKRDLGT